MHYNICNTNIYFNCSPALYSTVGSTTEILNGSKVFLPKMLNYILWRGYIYKIYMTVLLVRGHGAFEH